MRTIHVQRFTTDARPTVGLVQVQVEGGWFQCFSLEDRYRDGKVAGDTRIPEGVYKLVWRKVGRFAKRWQARGFPGSLQLMDVPGFEYVLIHAGNTKRDTEGCLLLGMGADLDTRTISKSRVAVAKVYGAVAAHEGPWTVVVR